MREATDRQLQHQREHSEATALRNATLQFWKDHFEQDSLDARAILCKAASDPGVNGAFELADVSRACFAHFPPTLPSGERDGRSRRTG